jgi:hypothetical protein
VLALVGLGAAGRATVDRDVPAFAGFVERFGRASGAASREAFRDGADRTFDRAPARACDEGIVGRPFLVSPPLFVVVFLAANRGTLSFREPDDYRTGAFKATRGA